LPTSAWTLYFRGYCGVLEYVEIMPNMLVLDQCFETLARALALKLPGAQTIEMRLGQQ
jgi:hypothetical protein